MVRLLCILCVVLVASSFNFAQDSTAVSAKFSAKIAADSTQPFIQVNELSLDYVFAGYGYYNPQDFPSLVEFPLENGENIHFDRVKYVAMTGERVQWKKYLPPEQRKNFVDVDKEGYRHYSDVEVNLRIVDWDGNVFESRLKRPEYSDVYLKGVTARGDFELQVDQENQKTVEVVFLPRLTLTCSKDASHIFYNQSYNYCPICGAPLVPKGANTTSQNVQLENTQK